MPLKLLNLGVSKKIGQSDYGSLAASCHVELELDQDLLRADRTGFHDRVQKTFTACRQAANDELARSQSIGGQEPRPGFSSRRPAQGVAERLVGRPESLL